MYRYILANLYKMRVRLTNEVKRFDMPDFRPRDEYIREMQRFGFLPKDRGPDDPIGAIGSRFGKGDTTRRAACGSVRLDPLLSWATTAAKEHRHDRAFQT